MTDDERFRDAMKHWELHQEVIRAKKRERETANEVRKAKLRARRKRKKRLQN